MYKGQIQILTLEFRVMLFLFIYAECDNQWKEDMGTFQPVSTLKR